MCYMESRVPIRVQKFPVIPAWVDGRTLVVASSYSGNTIETVRMYHQARERGCQTVVITSGGILRREAERNGDILILMPEGMHPRHSIGFMIGYTLGIIRAAGGPDLSSRMRSFLPSLKRYREEVSPPGPGGLAWEIAHEFVHFSPLICSDSSMDAVVFRWKTQINENAKRVAFCDSFPGFLYSEISAFRDSGRENYLAVVLEGVDDDICVGTRSVVEGEAVLRGTGIPMRIVRLGGASAMENMFRAVILGDYVSVYMAEARGIDSSDVEPVRALKEKIKRMPGNTDGAS